MTRRESSSHYPSRTSGDPRACFLTHRSRRRRQSPRSERRQGRSPVTISQDDEATRPEVITRTRAARYPNRPARIRYAASPCGLGHSPARSWRCSRCRRRSSRCSSIRPSTCRTSFGCRRWTPDSLYLPGTILLFVVSGGTAEMMKRISAGGADHRRSDPHRRRPDPDDPRSGGFVLARVASRGAGRLRRHRPVQPGARRSRARIT